MCESHLAPSLSFLSLTGEILGCSCSLLYMSHVGSVFLGHIQSCSKWFGLFPLGNRLALYETCRVSFPLGISSLLYMCHAVSLSPWAYPSLLYMCHVGTVSLGHIQSSPKYAMQGLFFPLANPICSPLGIFQFTLHVPCRVCFPLSMSRDVPCNVHFPLGLSSLFSLGHI